VNNKNKGKHNLRAYEGVEDLKTFRSQEAIKEYRQERKNFSSGAVSFLSKRIEDKKLISVLDIGSGSSSFLYTLHDAGILSNGMGIEISKTRHAFAEQWKRDGQYLSITNVNKDVSKVSFKGRKFDICTILDSTFTYLFPVDINKPKEVLKAVKSVLNKRGWLILDMHSFVDAKCNCKATGVHYYWQELPESNKFRYSLYRQNILLDDVLSTESRYIYRDKPGDTKKTEYSKMYTAVELKRMVLEAGFQKPLFYGGYDESTYDPQKSKRIVLTCRV